MRHAAWLHAALEGKPGSDAPRTSRLARLRQARGEDHTQDLPPIPYMAHLVAHLWEAGPLVGGGAAPAALSFGEIAAWQALTGARLTPWEARTLRGLSMDYLAELARAEKPDCPAPWQDAPQDRTALAGDMKTAIRKMLQ